MSSVLDKHPAPWTCTGGVVRSANGSRPCDDLHICSLDPRGEWQGREEDDAVERLILAAPELLAVLKECVRFVPNTGGPGPFGEARAVYDAAQSLIARIEGGK